MVDILIWIILWYLSGFVPLALWANYILEFPLTPDWPGIMVQALLGPITLTIVIILVFYRLKETR